MHLLPPSLHSKDTAFRFAEYFPTPWRPYLFLLWKKLQEGHICIDETEVEAEAEGLSRTEAPAEEEEFISDGSVIKPVVRHEGKLYLHRYFVYESMILDRILEFISDKEKSKPADSSQAGAMEQTSTSGLQQVGVAVCLMHDFAIITGGPGTGKTTTILSILKVLFAQNPALRVALAAPTGKAAARMAESLKERASGLSGQAKEAIEKLEPATIHRLLGTIPHSTTFRHHKDRPLEYEVVIIDESSMIDVALFAKLLEAVPKGAKLILLGDKNQLASVEAGSLFGDLCDVPGQLNVFSQAFGQQLQGLLGNIPGVQRSDDPSLLSDHIVELKESFRFSPRKGTGKLSRLVIDEDVDGVRHFIGVGDEVVHVDQQYSEELFDDFVIGFKSYIDEPDIREALKKLNDCRVLCAVREGRRGLYETNRRVEAVLEGAKLIRPGRPFYLHRPVMITKNNYALELFNGDTGIVRPDQDGSLKVWFDINGEITGFAPALISNEVTAFALTIHKSQGSEFDRVLVILPETDSPILTKELVYTAITRARSGVLIQTNEDVFIQSIQRSVKRASGLKHRFKSLSEK